MDLPPWDSLRFVLAAVRERSLSGAARALRVDPTTVTRRLRATEERLEVKLFESLRGGVELTSAGRHVVEAALAVEARILELSRTLAAAEPAVAGPVRLTVSQPLATTWFQTFHGLSLRYPQLSLELVVDDRYRSLSRREADVALRRAEAPPEHLVGRRLSKVADALYGAPTLKGVPLEELPWIGWSSATNEGVIERARARFGGSPPRMFASSMMVLLEAARSGHAVVFLSCAVGDADEQLVRLSEPVMSQQPLWLLTHPDLQESPRVRAVMDHLASFVVTQRDALAGTL